MNVADRDEIVGIVADIERGLNENDADLMTRRFAADARVVGANGRRIDGREAIDESHRSGLAGFLRDERVRYVVDDVRQLAPDFALAWKSAYSVDADGGAEPNPSMNALYVFVRRAGSWEIEARQNTLVP